MEISYVYRATEGIFRYQGWPTVCKDENDVLYAVFSGQRVAHVCPFGKNLMCKSTDGGVTWSVPSIVNDTYLDNRDAGICYLGNGKLIMSYFSHSSEKYSQSMDWVWKHLDEFSLNMTRATIEEYEKYPKEINNYGSFCKISTDYGATWSESYKVPITSPHGPTLTPSGRLLWVGKEFWSIKEKHGEIMLFESFDGGKSWEEISVLPCPEWAELKHMHEPYVVELPNGELFASVRVNALPGYPRLTLCFYRSTDGGRTWDAPTYLGTVGAPPHMLVLNDGRLLLTYGRRKDEYSIRAAISDDGGRSFGEEIILDSHSTSDDLGYPSTAQLKDGSLVTVYYKKAENDKATSILSVKWKA